MISKHVCKILTISNTIRYHRNHLEKKQKHIYRTPLGDLPLDIDTLAELRKTQEFSFLPMDVDEAQLHRSFSVDLLGGPCTQMHN